MKRTEYTISEIDADFDYEFNNVENIDIETPENTTHIATFANTFDEFHSDFEVLTGMDENTFGDKCEEVENELGEVFHKVVIYTDDSDLVKVEWFVNSDKKEIALSIIAHSDSDDDAEMDKAKFFEVWHEIKNNGFSVETPENMSLDSFLESDSMLFEDADANYLKTFENETVYIFNKETEEVTTA